MPLGGSGEEACCKSWFVLGATEEVQPIICYILEVLRRFSRHSIMLRSKLHESIPPETVRVACAALDEDNRYRKLREHFDTVFSDHAFEALFPMRGQPAATPWRLALVTVLQFAEGLSDREAAEAGRKVESGRLNDEILDVWLVGQEDSTNGYKIIMRGDGKQFGLASSGFPNDRHLVLVGWYGSLLSAFLAM